MAYYRAVHLTRIVDWYCHGEAKQWVAMELEDSNDTVKSWPWITCSLPKALSDHPTLGSTLSVDRDAFRHSSISPLPSLLVRILGSPEFIPGLQNPHFQRLAVSGHLHLCDFFGTRQSALPLCATATDPPLDFWSSLQLHNFLRRCSRTPGLS